MAKEEENQKSSSKSSNLLGCGCLTFIVLLLIGGCGALFGSGGDEEPKIAEEPETEEVAIDEPEKSTDPEEPVEEVEEDTPAEEEEVIEEPEVETGEEEIVEESEVEEDLTSEQEIENTIFESLGEENVTEMNITEYDGSFEVDITFAASENFTANMTANGIRRDIVDTTLDLKEINHYISYLLLTATLPLTDDSGNESDGQVMAVSFNGETIEELNSDNEVFLYDNLERVADGYSVHPDFR